MFQIDWKEKAKETRKEGMEEWKEERRKKQKDGRKKSSEYRSSWLDGSWCVGCFSCECGLFVGTRWSWITSVTYQPSWSWRQEPRVSLECRSLGHGAGLGIATNNTSLPTGTPSLSLRSSRLTTWSQNRRRVGVLSSGMWRFVVNDVASLNPELQIAHRTQSSLSLPWENKISYSHYTDRATRLSIFNIIRFISEWLRFQQFILEGLAFKDLY